MRSINRMIKAVISIVILTLSFAGIPAQAFVQSNDHSCCQSDLNLMAEPMTAMPMTSINAESQISDLYVDDNVQKHEIVKTMQNEESAFIDSLQVDGSCDDCDSPLSCFSVDGVSFVLSYPSKMNLGFPRSDSGLSTEPQFITLLVPPEIRPPKV